MGLVHRSDLPVKCARSSADETQCMTSAWQETSFEIKELCHNGKDQRREVEATITTQEGAANS